MNSAAVDFVVNALLASQQWDTAMGAEHEALASPEIAFSGIAKCSLGELASATRRC